MGDFKFLWSKALMDAILTTGGQCFRLISLHLSVGSTINGILLNSQPVHGLGRSDDEVVGEFTSKK